MFEYGKDRLVGKFVEVRVADGRIGIAGQRVVASSLEYTADGSIPS